MNSSSNGRRPPTRHDSRTRDRAAQPQAGLHSPARDSELASTASGCWYDSASSESRRGACDEIRRPPAGEPSPLSLNATGLLTEAVLHPGISGSHRGHGFSVCLPVPVGRCGPGPRTPGPDSSSALRLVHRPWSPPRAGPSPGRSQAQQGPERLSAGVYRWRILAGDYTLVSGKSESFKFIKIRVISSTGNNISMSVARLQ